MFGFIHDVFEMLLNFIVDLELIKIFRKIPFQFTHLSRQASVTYREVVFYQGHHVSETVGLHGLDLSIVFRRYQQKMLAVECQVLDIRVHLS